MSEKSAKPKRSRTRRLAFWSILGIVVLLLVGQGALFFVDRSEAGQNFLLDQVVSRIEGQINGELSVGGVRSPRLFQGARLIDVAVRDSVGSLVLQADSVAASYSIWGLVRGDFRISRVKLWRPNIRISRPTVDSPWNIQTLLVPSQTTSEISVTPTLDEEVVYRLSEVEIEDGTVEVLQPLGADAGDRALVVDGPNGVPLRQVRMETLTGALEDVAYYSYSTPDSIDPAKIRAEARLNPLSFRGFFSEDPAEVQRLDGDLSVWDGRIQLRDFEFALPESEGSGSASVVWGDEVVAVADIDVETVAFGDLHWVSPQIPDRGTASGVLSIQFSGGVTTLDIERSEVRYGSSDVEVEGAVRVGRSIDFQDLQLRSDDIQFSDLALWAPSVSDREGGVAGSVALAGQLGALDVSGVVSLIGAGGERSDSIDVSGVVQMADTPTLQQFMVSAESFRMASLRPFVSGWELGGSGQFNAVLDGTLQEGMELDLNLVHRDVRAASTNGVSRVQAIGQVRRPSDEEPVLNLSVELMPLSFSALKVSYPSVPVSGAASGSLRFSGPLSANHLEGVLQSELGDLQFQADLDLLSPEDGHVLTGSFDRFEASNFFASLPDSSTATGEFEIHGRGLSLEDLETDGSLHLTTGLIGGIRLDSSEVVFRVRNGVALLDDFSMTGVGFQAEGNGSLALRENAPPGLIEFTFGAESLAELRPLIRGQDLLVQPEPGSLERDLMILRGVDPDTLPTLEDVIVDGALEGRATLEGSSQLFTLAGSASLDQVWYGRSFLESGEVDFSWEGLPEREGRIRVDFRSDSLLIEGRGFSAATADIDFTNPRGRAVVTLERDATEDYRARAAFELFEDRRVLHLDEMVLRFGDDRWSLGSPSRIQWAEGGVAVQDFRLVQPGTVGVRLEVDGSVDADGEADLEVDIAGFPLARWARLLQVEDRGIGGVLSLQAVVGGVVDNPTIVGSFDLTNPSYLDYTLDALTGSLDYANQDAQVTLLGNLADRDVFRANGTVPVDLSFRELESRVVDRSVQLEVSTDSLPASVLLSVIDGLSAVEGTLSGSVDVTGRLDSLSPNGRVELQAGAVVVEPLGVRHRDGSGTFVLSPDGTVAVDLTARTSGGGSAVVTGIIDLSPDRQGDGIFDPQFDLAVDLDNFLALNRRDISGRIDGNLMMGGYYRSPVITGDIRVRRGDLYLEEFSRSSRVLDLNDPALRGFVDSQLAFGRPFLELGENPFLENLRAEVRVELDRDTWIRGEDLNVEIGGELLVTYSRSQRDLALLGTLNAIRGQYTTVRQFQVQQGTVDFSGAAGLNPDLDIQATTQVRRVEGDPLDVTATLTGTLADPRVTFTTDEPGVAESDILSYLVIGRPSLEFSTQRQGLAGGVLTTAAGLGLSQLGAVIGREIGLDYLAISQDQGLLSSTGFGSSFGQTRFEVGWYLAPDLFVTLLTRPLAQSSNSQFAGVRLEWRARDLFSVEGFWEDRFLRQGVGGFGGLGIQASKVGGVFFFREWGY